MQTTDRRPTELIVLLSTAPFFTVCLAIASVACSKKPAPAASPTDGPDSLRAEVAVPSPEGSSVSTAGSAGSASAAVAGLRAAEPSLPPSFRKFERLIVPLVTEAESEARNVKVCKMLEELRIASLALPRDMPKGVDATAWQAASDELLGAFEGLGGACMDDPPGFTSDLDIAYESYQRLCKLFPVETTQPDEVPFVPVAFLKFEDLMRPLVRQAPSKARSAKTCGALPKFEEVMLAMTQAAPKQVDRGPWDAASKALQTALANLKATCAKNPPSDSPGLGALDVSYVRLHDLLPQ